MAIVSLPEEMPVNETAALERSLTEDVGVAVDQIYMNAMYPERFSEQEAEKLARVLEITEGPPQAAVRAAVSEQRRAHSQRAQLAAAGAQRQRADQDAALHLQAAPGRALP